MHGYIKVYLNLNSFKTSACNTLYKNKLHNLYITVSMVQKFVLYEKVMQFSFFFQESFCKFLGC